LLLDQPSARLRLRAPSFGDAAVRAEFTGYFAARGIAPERVGLLGPISLDDMPRDYGEIDIALDPIPYNGGATTLQALWMGVPVSASPGAISAAAWEPASSPPSVSAIWWRKPPKTN
jgi:protein O-GlcNAc transferase